MQHRVIKFDMHIIFVTHHIYFKFQANTLSSFRNIQIHVKIEEYFLSHFLPSSVILTLSRQKGNMGSAHPVVKVNI